MVVEWIGPSPTATDPMTDAVAVFIRKANDEWETILKAARLL